MKIFNKIIVILIGLSIFGMVLPNSAQARETEPCEPIFDGYVNRWIYVGFDYANPGGSNGDWTGQNVFSYSQILMRPEIPGTISMKTTQSTTSTLTMSNSLSLSTSVGLKVTNGLLTAEAKVESGVTIENTAKITITHSQTSNIDINNTDEDEMKFSGRSMNVKYVTKAYEYELHTFEVYRDACSKWRFEIDLGIANVEDPFKVILRTTILDISMGIYYIGVGFDNDNPMDHINFPWAKETYDKIQALDPTVVSGSEDVLWGDGSLQFSDTNKMTETNSHTVVKSISVSVSVSGGFTKFYTLNLSFTAKYDKSTTQNTETGVEDVATFVSGFHGTGVDYPAKLLYLHQGGFYIKERMVFIPCIPCTFK